MFNFYRVINGKSELWRILLKENSVPNAAKRFGNAVLYRFVHGPSDSLWHEVGFLCTFNHHNSSANREETEILLTCKKHLTEEEKRILCEETELLIGKYVWTGGSEWDDGFFLQDGLTN